MDADYSLSISPSTLKSDKVYLMEITCTDSNSPGYIFNDIVELHTTLINGNDNNLTSKLYLNSRGIGFNSKDFTEIVCAVPEREGSNFEFEWLI